MLANVINNGSMVLEVKKGERICQLAIRKADEVSIEVVDNLDDDYAKSERGDNGFGSTGTK